MSSDFLRAVLLTLGITASCGSRLHPGFVTQSRDHFAANRLAGLHKLPVFPRVIPAASSAGSVVMSSDSGASHSLNSSPAAPLDKDEMYEARKLFAILDYNGDGQVSKTELKAAIKKSKLLKKALKLWNIPQAVQFFDKVDTNHDGRMSFEEFTAYLARIWHEKAENTDHQSDMEALFDSAFEKADANRDGGMSFDEFTEYLASGMSDDFLNYVELLPQLDEGAVAEAAKTLFNSIDYNHDGEISKTELDKALKNSTPLRDALKVYSFKDAIKFIDNADADRNGRVSFEEFKSYLALSCFEEFKQYVDKIDCAPILDEGAMAEARSLFDSIDNNGDGQLSKKELQVALANSTAVRKALKIKSLTECMAFVDTAGHDGTVSFDEFTAYLGKSCVEEFKEYIKQIDTPPPLDENAVKVARTLYDSLDKCENGKVCKSELNKAFAMSQKIRNALNPESLNFKEDISDDDDEEMSFEQFMTYLTKDGNNGFKNYLDLMRTSHPMTETKAKEETVSSAVSRTTSPRMLSDDADSKGDSEDVPGLSQEALAEAWTLFGILDYNGDGQVSKTELRDALSKSSQIRKALNVWTIQEAGKYFNQADVNSDGRITFDEFTKSLAIQREKEFKEYVNKTETPPLLAEGVMANAARGLFNSIDYNQDGQISKTELDQALKKSLPLRDALKVYSFRECANFIDNADTDNDGRVDFEEFQKYLALSCFEQFKEYVEGLEGAPLLDETALAEAKVLFDSIDENGDGQLSRTELSAALTKSASIRKALKVQSFQECIEFVDEADTDKDGTVSFEEFTNYLSKRCLDEFKEYVEGIEAPPALDLEAVKVAKSLFDSIDRNSDGSVSKEELTSALKGSATIRNALNVWSFKSGSQFIDNADLDKDGEMSFEEFKTYLSASMPSEFKDYVELVQRSRTGDAQFYARLGEIAQPYAEYSQEKLQAPGAQPEGSMVTEEVAPELLELEREFLSESPPEQDLAVDEEVEPKQGEDLESTDVSGGPRQVNAQVVILRERGQDYDVLLQLRSNDAPVMRRHLATIGGERDEADEDSSVTATRKVVEKTGLLDLWPLNGAPLGWLLRFVVRPDVEVPAPPRKFHKFAEGTNVDWWALLLEGSGSFDKQQSFEYLYCDDLEPMLAHLPGAEAADCFGHAWVPVDTVYNLDWSTPMMYGMQRKISEAVESIKR